MIALTISAGVFACIFIGALAGMLLRSRLPDHHLSSESRDVVKLGMGLIGTMTALVLGLLIASAKGTYDNQRIAVAQLAANAIMLDQSLAHYGKETQEARDLLRASLTDLIRRTWPDESPAEQPAMKTGTEVRYEGVYDKIQDLAPKNDAQRSLKDQALKTALDIRQTRWMMYAQKGTSIPTPFLAVMVCWLTLILGSFGLFAPANGTAVAALLLCSLAVASATFLILELDRPFSGVMQISSEPMRNALEQLGR